MALSKEVSDLQAQVGTEQAEVAQLIALNQSEHDELVALNARIQAGAGGGPSSEDIAALQDLTTRMKATSDAVAAALKANSASGQPNA